VETSLLSTKLNIPPLRPQLVQRPRLNERLQEGLNYKLVLISAPAGFGKTTLLSEWVYGSKPPINTAWISLDEGDNDPIRFWDYFIASIKKLQPDFGDSTRALLHTPQPPPVEELLTAIINELAVISNEFSLVLDDYHLIESHQIHDGITYLLEHMPVKMHLMIASRADPSLPLSRFRGKGIMLEVRTDDLRFNLEDAGKLLKELKISELSEGDIVVLNERTEGWVVGLKMAALSIREQKDVSGFITAFTGSQRYVMDYLVEEVLQKQTQEVRVFLMKTSILERICVPLCDVITERHNSNDILLKLEQNHLFIVPLDESRNWYRYEHLFADILRHQCETTYGTGEIAKLHKQASQWYEDNDFPDEAIKHALTVQDWDNAARLITEQSKNKTKSGEFVTLINWLQALPEDIVQANYQLCLTYCSALIQIGQLDAAELKIKTLEKMTEGDESIKGEVIAMEATIAWIRHDVPLSIELAEKALPLLPSDSLGLRSSMFLILGSGYLSSDLKESEKLLTESYELARQADEDYIALFALTLLGIIQMRWGKLHRAAEMYRQAIELTEPSPAAVTPHLIMGMICNIWNDLEAADNHVQRVIKLSRLTGYPERLVNAYHELVYTRFAQGDEAGALEAIEMADVEAQKLGSLDVMLQHTAYCMLFAIKRDDMTTALEWGNKLSKLSENIDALPWQVSDAPARLLLAQGKKKAAAEQLHVLYEKAVQSGEQYFMITHRVYQSLAAETEETALEFLSDSLVMAEPEGWIHIFVDEGRMLKPLLEKALSRGITPEYTRKLISIIESEERRRKEARKGEMLLSERELEVLQLITLKLSNKQIAERLFISPGTVKIHVHNILDKLGATVRSEAVAHAREIRLI